MQHSVSINVHVIVFNNHYNFRINESHSKIHLSCSMQIRLSVCPMPNNDNGNVTNVKKR